MISIHPSRVSPLPPPMSRRHHERLRLRSHSVSLVGSALLIAGLQVGCAAESQGGLAESDVALDVSASDLFRIGAVDGESWETFAGVDRVRFDGAGNLYIFDRNQHRVVVVDPEGRHVRNIGSRGEGPGQLRMPMMMEVTEDGTVIIGDIGARAYVVYGPDGSWLRSVTLTMDEGFPSPVGLLHPDGAILTWAASNITMRSGPAGAAGAGGTAGAGGATAAGGAPDGPPPGVPLRLTAIDGSGTHTVGHAWVPPRESLAATFATGAGGAMRMTGGMPPLRAFEPRIHVAVLPNGSVAFADSTDYRIRLVDAGGSAVATATRAIEPHPVSDAERAREQERRLADLESGALQPPTAVVMRSDGGGGSMSMGGPDWEEDERERIRSMDFWEEIPVIQRLAADWDGRLWVERAALPGDQGPIDLVDSRGAYLGSIAPAGVRTPAAFGPGGLAAYIERDDFDVPFVRVVRLGGLPDA